MCMPYLMRGVLRLLILSFLSSLLHIRPLSLLCLLQGCRLCIALLMKAVAAYFAHLHTNWHNGAADDICFHVELQIGLSARR